MAPAPGRDTIEARRNGTLASLITLRADTLATCARGGLGATIVLLPTELPTSGFRNHLRGPRWVPH